MLAGSSVDMYDEDRGEWQRLGLSNDRCIGTKLLIWLAGAPLENQAVDKDTYLKADEDTHCPLSEAVTIAYIEPEGQRVCVQLLC